MKINQLLIKNFKSIRELSIENIDHALILVGRNSTGKTVILEAILAAFGKRAVQAEDFDEDKSNIEIRIALEITKEDLMLLHQKGIVSRYKKYELWFQEFCKKLPSYQQGILTFTAVIHNRDGLRYEDGYSKNNTEIPMLFPKIYYLDYHREVKELQDDIFLSQDNLDVRALREDRCIFDHAKACNMCFHCIKKVEKKAASELTITETVRLLEYQLFQIKLDSFLEKVNGYFHKNGSPAMDAYYKIHFDVDNVFCMETQLINRETKKISTLDCLSAGTRSIYMLSMLESYIEEDSQLPCIILMEDPELFLHPHLQKVASEILYQVSLKNQVIFCTHSPNLIFNFTSKQIRQVVLDKEYYTTVQPTTNLSVILNDLGYTASDLMDVSFVFFVEGKQDKSRLPLLLNKYYAEIVDQEGNLRRTAIISTNSCTNIKTYANLKYINQLYIRDQFLMIRDSDGKDKEGLIRHLCSYYRERNKQDERALPRVTRKNVLVLKYYSFENYFLNPEVMAAIGVVKSVDQFYEILWKKYNDYLYRLSSFVNLKKRTGIVIASKQDMIEHMEEIKIYGRGHNLFDIFYGRYKGGKEREILKRYIDAAPKETFQDILDAINQFVYFQNRKR